MKRLKVLSLAALVAFAACDEGTEPVVAPPVTGTISGVVTIEGTAKSGVSVTLSSGAAATTDASGAYSFAGVNAGTYTITISGFPTDATFSTTTKGATIATSGQVATVNFDGAYVRTSAILGSVSAGSKGLAGVKVALTGTNTAGASVNTDGNGQYAFTGLRAGSYTVTISGFDATQYTFASSTASVTVAAGASQVASFTGTLLATSKITGTVKIDGAAVAGVTATLTPGGATATTDAAGAYTFASLAAGTYTVTISGYAADATFTTPAQVATITSAGSTVTANFDGAYIKTASVTGTVTVSGNALAGVTVTLGTASVNTDSNGQYSFAALRAGTYTLTISGWNSTMYTFATTTASVTLTMGQSKVQSFAGAYVATAKISGSLFIDELPKNDTFDPAEAAYKLAGVTVKIEGGIINNISTTTTDANGAYSFTGLVPGNYRVTLTAPAAGTLAFGGTADNQLVLSLAPGGSVIVNWPFDIAKQYVKAYSFLGKDASVAAPAGVGVGIRALAGITLSLYDTYANAVTAGATGRIGSAATDATGGVSFNFARTLDTSPAGPADNIVFARFVSASTANKTLNGETVIEIKYNAQDTLVMAPDTFDVLNTGVIMRFDAKQPDGNLLKGWAVALYRNATDTVIAGTALQSGLTNATSGLGRFVEAYGTAALPDTFYIRLADAGAQAGANLHNFTQTPAPLDGTAGGRFLRVIVDGTNPDSLFVGTQNILWGDQDIYIKAHNEKDDTAKFTTLDAVANSDNLDVQIFKVNSDGTRGASQDGPYALGVGTGTIVFGINGGIPKRLPTGTYQVVSRSRVATQTLVSDSVYTMVLDGSKQQDTAKAQMASATHPMGYSSFAWKYNNTKIAGTVRAADGTDGNGVKVRITSAANFIGPVRDTTITIAGGSYSKSGLLEGPYTVTATAGDSSAVWGLLVKITGNTSATEASRETEGALDDKIVNFRATRLDTQVKGVVVNDRDTDLTTIDPNEALPGATIQLYRDGSGTITLDTLVATTTTDANGSFGFTGLIEGRYAIKALSVGNALVLRAESKDTAIVTTAATTTGSGANNTRVVGVVPPAVLPRWDYNNSTADGGYLPGNFTFLFTDTKVKGTVKTGGGVAIPGMLISLRRCNVSAGATSPPSGAGVCTTYLGTTVNLSSDASGAFEFGSLREGVYEVRPQPTTVAGWTTSTPAQILYITVGTGDIENYDFVIS
jgi:hypothetical protein